MNFPVLRFPGFTNKWQKATIQELIDDGAVLSHLDGNHGALYPKSNEFSDSGVPYITANDFISGQVSFTSCKYLPVEKAAKFKKGVAKNGDVLFAHNATVGPTALLNTEFDYVILSTTATYFRLDLNKISNTFFLYCMQSESFIEQYTKVMSQSTRNQVPITTQRKLSIYFPSIAEQRKIGLLISLIDQKILHLTKKHELLTTYKIGVMQKLFDQEIRFKDDAGKEYPNWNIVRIGDVCTPKQYQTISSSELLNSGFPVYGANGLIGYFNKYNHEEEVVAVTCRGATCGEVTLIPPKSYVTGNSMCLDNLVPNKITTKFMYYAVIYKGFRSVISGSAQPQIVGSAIRSVELSLPSIEEQKKIASFLSKLDEKISNVQEQLNLTKQYKQGLLQQMFV